MYKRRFGNAAGGVAFSPQCVIPHHAVVGIPPAALYCSQGFLARRGCFAAFSVEEDGLNRSAFKASADSKEAPLSPKHRFWALHAVCGILVLGHGPSMEQRCPSPVCSTEYRRLGL